MLIRPNAAFRASRSLAFIAFVCSFVQVADSGNVLGGFIAPAWPAQMVDRWIPELEHDPTLRSFAFSLVNAYNRPVKMKLEHLTFAALHQSECVCLCSNSITLMHQERPLNEENANSDKGLAPTFTALDDQYERKYGFTAPTFNMGPGFMPGMPNGYFACAEIEVFAMQPHRNGSRPASLRNARVRSGIGCDLEI